MPRIAKHKRKPEKGTALLRGFVTKAKTSFGEFQLYVWCPYCNRMHIHGWGADTPDWAVEHRAAHCDQGPLRDHGYYIGKFRKCDLEAGLQTPHLFLA